MGGILGSLGIDPFYLASVIPHLCCKWQLSYYYVWFMINIIIQN